MQKDHYYIIISVLIFYYVFFGYKTQVEEQSEEFNIEDISTNNIIFTEDVQNGCINLDYEINNNNDKINYYCNKDDNNSKIICDDTKEVSVNLLNYKNLLCNPANKLNERIILS